MEKYGNYLIEFYKEKIDKTSGCPEPKRVKEKKMRGLLGDVQFYADEQIDMGKYDSYKIYTISTHIVKR